MNLNIRMKQIARAAIVVSILMVLAGCSSQTAGNAKPVSPSESQPAAPTTAARSEAPSVASDTGSLPSVDPTDASKLLISPGSGSTTSTVGSAKVVPGSEIAAKKIKAVPVLYYHSVQVEQGNELRMPPSQFREQMQYLKDHNYQVIHPAEILSFLKGEGNLPKNPVMITFDDGYADNYTNAYPILKEFGFTATVFMISGALDSNGFLSTSEIQDLAANGWTIGAHTKNHEHLPQLQAARQVEELKGAKDTIEQKIGRPVTAFAYPFGEYNVQVKKEVQDLGYTLAFTTERGWAKQGTDPLLIQRVYCYANMGMQEFKRRIENPTY